MDDALSNSQQVLNELSSLDLPSPPENENVNGRGGFHIDAAFERLDFEEDSSPTKKSMRQRQSTFDFYTGADDLEENLEPNTMSKDARSVAKAWIKNLSTPTPNSNTNTDTNTNDDDENEIFHTPHDQLKTIKRIRIESDKKDAQNFHTLQAQSVELNRLR